MNPQARPFTASTSKLAYAQAFSRANASHGVDAHAAARRHQLMARLLHRRG